MSEINQLSDIQCGCKRKKPYMQKVRALQKANLRRSRIPTLVHI
jgi:hypothetical protein